MKITIELSDDIYFRARELARSRKMTFKTLLEDGLRRILSEEVSQSSTYRFQAVVQSGQGMTGEFTRDWAPVRDVIYPIIAISKTKSFHGGHREKQPRTTENSQLERVFVGPVSPPGGKE